MFFIVNLCSNSQAGRRGFDPRPPLHPFNNLVKLRGIMSFLGIDIGTSFIKGAVMCPELQELGHIKRIPFPDAVQTGNPLQCEYEPREILKAVKSFLDELAAHAPDCEGLLVCTQMHGLVVTNDQNEPMSNCITWRDQRAMMPHPSGG